MLIYESDGFLEAEVKDISQLCRSKQFVSFGEGDNDSFELQAILCEYQDKNTRRCRAAFFAKSLKRALVFTVSDAEKKAAWQHGQEVLAEFGFDLESVNLKLSPAMLDVVLRDVPGLSAPAAARKLRTEEMQETAELQKIVDEDPESPQGKKATLKLSAGKRTEEKLEKLRQVLEVTLSPEEQSNEEVEALLAQVKDLTTRLEEAEKRAEEERSQKEFSEAVTTAAEKRIQELEEVLVDVETKSSGELKLKRKIVSLQSQVKELKAELEKSRNEMNSERDKQGQFVDDVKSAQATISSLEESLKEKDKAFEDAQVQLEEGLAEHEELEAELKEARLRLKVLSKDLELKSRADSQVAEVTAQFRQLEEQLSEAQQALQVSEEVNRDLRDEFEQESSVRRRLERGAAADDKRISELEEALAVSPEDNSEATEGDDNSARVAELKDQLANEQSKRQDLEVELDDAHKMVDSLEQMIREREEGAGGWQTSNADKSEKDGSLEELSAQVQQMEAQLEQEQLEQKKLAEELSAAEHKVEGLEEEIRQLSEELEANTAVKDSTGSFDETAPPEVRKLPHEMRPEPQKGAFFRPDWDLEGLPCKSTEDVLQVWETVFNVQMSIEGYPNQYCTAFVALLRDGKQKKVYILYRLKTNKHTLVCVPAKKPKDEKSLEKAIKEAIAFLKTCGFEMEEMAPEHIDGALKSYFVG
jgi:chromosome segregation ATPase